VTGRCGARNRASRRPVGRERCQANIRRATDTERCHGSAKGGSPEGWNPKGGSGMKQARDARGSRQGAKRERNPGRAEGSRSMAASAWLAPRAVNTAGANRSLAGAMLAVVGRDVRSDQMATRRVKLRVEEERREAGPRVSQHGEDQARPRRTLRAGREVQGREGVAEASTAMAVDHRFERRRYSTRGGFLIR
jgi:hypothetical protein